MLESMMATSYFVESAVGDESVGHLVRVESEVIGLVGWVGDNLIRVDLDTPVHYKVLLLAGLEMDRIVFHAKA